MDADSPVPGHPYIQTIQKLGRLLSGMIMPDIGVYIAWGLLTALFIPNGWLPNATLARLVEPIVTYLLPLLIGYTGGKLLYGHRGGMLGAMTTMGAIVGTSMPMIFGAMITGPMGAWVIKIFDDFSAARVPAGFEMLLNNFSGGIFCAVMAICAYLGIGPVLEYFNQQLGVLVYSVVDAGALALSAAIIEPAKVLFLNNAINHGVLSPLGVQQAAEQGKSILFLIETNPGPGMGILLAYYMFMKGTARHSAPGAMLIHFVGGIHEVYFPYVLMQPRLVLALIGGGAAGTLTFSLLDAGLVSVPSPGSILAVVAMTPRGGLLATLAGIFVSALVTFLLAALLINRKIEKQDAELAQAREKMVELKGANATIGHDCLPDDLVDASRIQLIAVACDAGMGSSALGASKLRAALIEAGVEVKVISCPIDQLASPVDLVITHEKLTRNAICQLPHAIHIAVTDFIATPVYEELADCIAVGKGRVSARHVETRRQEHRILSKDNIRLGLKSVTREEAIRQAGKILCERGYVEDAYIAGMLERESDFTTYIGNGAAIPHGTSESRKSIKHSGVCILQFPDGVNFNGNTAYLVIGIAAQGNQHLEILAELARVMEDAGEMERLRYTTDLDAVYRSFSGQTEHLEGLQASFASSG